jgi:hypothetical protein
MKMKKAFSVIEHAIIVVASTISIIASAVYLKKAKDDAKQKKVIT